MALIEIAVAPRSCECCGGRDLDPVWSSQSMVRKATADYRFHVHIVVCRACGFCFTSPGATSEALAQYYADGLTGYKGIGLPYAVEARLTVLDRFRAPSGVFAEVGGDRPDEFHRECGRLFGTVVNVDVAADTRSDCRSVDELPAGGVDVLAHYDVIEHITDVRRFLTACWMALKDDGVMICETPDVRLYPRNLIMSEYEHVNHFSVVTLASMGRQCALELTDVSHQCSRPYSFLAIFRKRSHLLEHSTSSAVEYLDTLACVRGGVEQILRVERQIASLRDRLIDLGSRGRTVTLWGVTDLLRRVLNAAVLPLPSTTIIVDSDPRRRTHLMSEGVTVCEPKDCVEQIRKSDLLAICAARYQDEIVAWVERHAGRPFNGDELVVLGRGPSGESLL